jgi:hypothetical protein
VTHAHVRRNAAFWLLLRVVSRLVSLVFSPEYRKATANKTETRLEVEQDESDPNEFSGDLELQARLLQNSVTD